MANTLVPWCCTRCAATSSCVDSGLDAHSATWAPPAWRVIARFAVSVVTCRHADRRFPASGRSPRNRSLSCRSTGIERSAHSVRRRPSSASRMSLMSFVALVLVAVSDIGFPGATRGPPLGRDFQLFHPIDVLPGEQLDVALADPALLGRAPEVAVGGRRSINGIAQIQRLDDPAGGQIEDFAYCRLECVLRHGPRPERIDHDGDGLGDADRVSNLGLAPLRESRGHNVLGHPTHGVRRGAIDLRGILAAERAATMPRHTTVAVDDNLATRESGIALWPANDKPSRGIHQNILILHIEARFADNRPDDVSQNAGAQFVVVDHVGGLRRYDDLFERNRLRGLDCLTDLRL